MSQTIQASVLASLATKKTNAKHRYGIYIGNFEEKEKAELVATTDSRIASIAIMVRRFTLTGQNGFVVDRKTAALTACVWEKEIVK